MSDDDVEPDTPAYRWLKHAIHIDTAIGETDSDGTTTTGWVLVRVSQSPEDDPSVAHYSYYDPPNQPIHIARGLIDMGRSHYANMCTLAEITDDEDDDE